MQISDIRNPWRIVLMSAPASFAGVMFHVETGSRNSGRRVVTHEYPKRDKPYSEDMGRHALRFQFSGYIIYKPFGGDQLQGNISGLRYDYVRRRLELQQALEKPDADYLVHPVFCPGQPLLVVCERYSMIENRERGGYTEFQMSFVEAGDPGNSITNQDFGALLKDASNSAMSSAAAFMNQIAGRDNAFTPTGTTQNFTPIPEPPDVADQGGQVIIGPPIVTGGT
jgi:prophage DNA circulation protein